ncbi:NfeD family protein [Chloroflexota bacterium]
MARLILAIISTILEEIAIVLIAQWALPQVNINISLPVLIAIMVGWLAYSIITYRIGSRALKKKPVFHLPDMVGSKGQVVSTLAPDGMIRISGELWVAKSVEGEIKIDEEVIVVEQNSLKLIVRKSKNNDD